MLRRASLITALCFFASPVFADGAKFISDYISSALPSTEKCSIEQSSILHTVDKLEGVSFPKTGKFVLANIAGGFLTAFEDGSPVLEMKTIVGKVEHPTPEFFTEITSVRLDPTWTAPNSIVKDEGWRDKISKDPDFFIRNKFEFRDGKGQLLTLREAVEEPTRINSWIQSPGPLNALGAYRFNIKSSESIYLHDTRDPENFFDGSPITLSHGCVRLEKPKKFALWLLGWDEAKLSNYVTSGTSFDFPLQNHVPIVIGYYPAWPAATGEVYIYEDVYSKVDGCKN